jgi:hypothetical protein
VTKLDRLLDLMAAEFEYKKRYTIAKSTSTCIWCGENAQLFGDAYSKLEYRCSALCQNCQDEFLRRGKS